MLPEGHITITALIQIGGMPTSQRPSGELTLHLVPGPSEMLNAQSGGFELAGFFVEAQSSFESLRWRHFP